MTLHYERLIVLLRKLSKPEFWITLQKLLKEEHEHQSRVNCVEGLPNHPELSFVWNRATRHKMAAPYMAADEAKREISKAKNAARKCRTKIDMAIAIYAEAGRTRSRRWPPLPASARGALQHPGLGKRTMPAGESGATSSKTGHE